MKHRNTIQLSTMHSGEFVKKLMPKSNDQQEFHNKFGQLTYSNHIPKNY